MKAGHLVLAANVITGTGKAEDRFSVLNGITYEKGTYSFNCALAKGMKVDNKEIGNIKTTNFGALAFDGDDRTQKLYGIKAGMENIKNRVSAQQPFGNLRITQAVRRA